MAKMFNRARMTVTSTGTGALSLGVAVAGYQTFSSAGALNNDVVSYAVEDGLKWEIGTGTYNSVNGTLSRTVTQSFDGTTYGTSAISVTTSAQVFISPLAVDLQYGTSAGNLVQLDGSAGLPAVDGSQLTALNASNISSGTINSARIPTLNQNTTGTAAGLSATLAVGSGGSGTTTAQGAINAFAGAVTSGSYLRGNGTNVVMSAIQAADVPTLNQNTTGTASNVTGTVAVANGGTGLTSLTAGRIPYGNGTSAFNNVSTFVFDGNNLGIGTTSPSTYGKLSVVVTPSTGGADGIYIPGSVTQLNSVVTGATYSFSGVGASQGWIYTTASDLNIGPYGSYNIKFIANNAERMRITSTGTVNIVGAGTAGSTQAVSLNGSAPINSMVLDASGRLGIGTTSPAQPLVVSSGGAQGIEISPIATASAPAIICYNRSTAAFIGLTQFASKFDWYIGASPAMTLDASGNLGVGTSSPTNKLSIQQSVNNTFAGMGLGIFRQGDDSELALGYRSDIASGAFVIGPSYNSTGSYLPLVFRTSDTIRMLLDTSGNVTLNSATFSPASPSTAGNLALTGSLVMGSSFKRNRIINGNMQVAQRGTSFTNVSNGSLTNAYTLDRWYGFRSSYTSNLSMSQQAGFGGSQYCLRVQRANTDTSTAQIIFGQIIESVNMIDLQGQTVTLSFFARTSSSGYSGGNLAVYVYTGTTADQGLSASVSGWAGVATPIATSQAITSTATKYSFTFTIASNALEMQVQFQWAPTGTAGATDYVEISNVQLEVGSVATPYERQTYSEQLAQCQRYYEQSDYLNSYIGARTVVGATAAYAQGFSFIIPKRVAPTVTLYNRAGTANKLSLVSTGAAVGTTVTALNSGAECFHACGDSGNGLSAGVVYEANYTASAEL